MASIHPYIHFNGNAEEAFSFYASAFGTKISKISRYKDISGPEFQVPENDANRIMHIVLPISATSNLLGSDTMEMMGKVTENDNRNAIFLSTDSRAEADKLFQGLSNGGKVEMPIGDGPLGNYFGMFTDKFGVEWMIEFGKK